MQAGGLYHIRSLGSRPPPFRARLNYAHAYAAKCLPHTHAHNLNAHGTGEAWNRGYHIRISATASLV